MARREDLLARYKEFILDPDKWPRWPILPLIKRDGSHKTAIIYGDPGKNGDCLFVDGANMYTTADCWKSGVLKNVDAILAEGWEVD